MKKQKTVTTRMSLLSCLMAFSLTLVGCSKTRDDREPVTSRNRFVSIQSDTVEAGDFNRGVGAASAGIDNGEIGPGDQVTYNWMMEQSPKLAGAPSYFLADRHYIQTGEQKVDNIGYSDAESLTVLEDATQFDINDYRYVRYETNSPYLDGVNIRAKENARYEIRYGYTEKYFNIYKVAEEDYIPFIERAYAQTLEDGRLMVPVAAYPVTYMQQVRSEDQFGNATNVLSYKPVTRLRDATHLEVDYSNLVTFDPIVRQNIVPSHYFKEGDEWFFASTVVEAELDSGEIIGRDASTDFSLQSVSRVKVIRNKQFLRFVNVNIAEELENSDVNLDDALKVLVDWVDLRRTRNGADAGYTTEILDSGSDSRNWQDRAFIQLNLQEVSSSLSDFGSNARIASAALEDLKIGRSFLSFLLAYDRKEEIDGRTSSNKIKVRYVLRRAHEAKPARVYDKDDQRRFGFFSTIKDFISSDYRNQREEDIRQKVFLNRYMPEVNENGEKEIKFHFTTLTTQDPLFRQVAKESVDVWNEAFAQAAAGSNQDPIKITIDTSREVDLGDIRFNSINMIDSPESGGLLGYGPSIVDTKSGEIIAATSNVYVNPLRLGAYRFLRDYVKAKVGAFDENYLLHIAGANSSVNLNGLSSAAKAKAKTELQNILDNGLVEQVDVGRFGTTKQGLQAKIQTILNGELKDVPHYAEYQRQKQAEILRHSMQNHQCDHQEASFGLHWEDTVEIVKNECSGIEEYIAEVKEVNAENPRRFHTSNEINVLESCVRKIMVPQLRGTMIHEMGHNFGLRHNFVASYDAKNFIGIKLDSRSGKPLRDNQGNLVFDQETLDRETGGVPVQATSIMEYMPSNKRELQKPGPYDVAAIRYGYADAVEMSNGDIVNIDTSKDIDENVGLDNIRDYAYCTDEDVFFAYDPTCQRHDFGTTPSEIVDNIILETNARFATSYYRYDRPNIHSIEDILRGIVNLSRAYLPLRNFYVEWRYQLKDFLLKSKADGDKLRSPHLEFMSGNDYQATLQEMAQDPEFGTVVREYYPAIQKAYSFLKDVAFKSNLYCVLGDETVAPKDKDVRSFVNVQNEIFQNTGVTVTSCEAPEVSSYYGQASQEVGHPLGNVLSSKEASDIVIDDATGQLTTNIEVIGTQFDKLFAFQSLVDRTVFSTRTMVTTDRSEELHPNFFDEPVFQGNLTQAVWESILNGKSSDLIGIDGVVGKRNILKFQEDRDLMTNFAVSMVIGLYNPMAQVQTKITPYVVQSTTDQNELQNAADYIQFNGSFLYAQEGSTQALRMIRKYKELDQQEQMMTSFVDTETGEVSQPNEQLLERLLQVTGFKPLTQTELQAITVKEYIDYYSKVIQGVQTLMQSSPATGFYAMNMLGADFQLLSLLTNPQVQQQISGDLNMTLKDFLSKYQQLGIELASLLSDSNFNDRQVQAQEQTAAQIAEAKEFYDNRKELSVQQDLIVQVLNRIAQML